MLSIFVNFAYPVRCFREPPMMTLLAPRVREPQAEDHWSRKCGILDVLQPYEPPRHVRRILFPPVIPFYL
jgi:hypothetical protein